MIEVNHMFRFLLVSFWAGLLFLFTCTSDLNALLQHQKIDFQWRANPSLMDFFLPIPIVPDDLFIATKIGHILSFLLFSILLYLSSNSLRTMVILCTFYAGATEFLQLYFQRGGRFYDVGFDIVGMILATLMIMTSKKIYPKKFVDKET